jgi:hypothetical protein
MSIEIKPFTIQDLVKRPYHYARYGDGNFLAIEEFGQVNCDGHSHTLPGLKADVLKTITSPKKSVTYGLTPFAKARCSETIEKYTSLDVTWYNGDIYMDGMLARDMTPLIPFLKANRVAMIGPPHFVKLEKHIQPEVYIEMGLNCYTQKDETVRTLKNEAPRFDVAIFAASFLSCTSIYELSDLWPDKWLIDVGSGLDPACGVMSRAYHKEAMPWQKIYGIPV